MARPHAVLAINAGSSSIKFDIVEPGPSKPRLLSGALERIGAGAAAMSWRAHESRGTTRDVPQAAEHATGFLLEWLQGRAEFAAVAAIGHRVVYGFAQTEPTRITPAIVAQLRGGVMYAPDHLPRAIDLMEAFARCCPELPQVACFDTAFHETMPRVAKLLPLPRRYEARGLRRYGFHGLSYAYLVEELARVAGPQAARGRVILAHLGNGASLAAVHRGRSIDTSMAFTPAAGLVMSTRSGDLDPGILSFLAHTEQMTVSEFHRMINHESGLLGVSGIGGDMRDLLEREADVRAAEAVALFCYQAKKWVGAFAAALGGLDTLVFSAGIGEHSAPVRARICAGLGFLGLEVDEARNASHAPVISSDASRVAVRVIPTDEELMIARSVTRLLGLKPHTTEPIP